MCPSHPWLPCGGGRAVTSGHETQAATLPSGVPSAAGPQHTDSAEAPGTSLHGRFSVPSTCSCCVPVLSKSLGITAWHFHGSGPGLPVTRPFLPKPHLPGSAIQPSSPKMPSGPGPSTRAPARLVSQHVTAVARVWPFGKCCQSDSRSPTLSCRVRPQVPELYSLGSNLNLTTNWLSGFGQVI